MVRRKNCAVPKEEIFAAFHTEIGANKYAAQIGMSPNTLRRIWKEEFGEETYKKRGKEIQAKAAAKFGHSMRGHEKVFKDVDVTCSECGDVVGLTTHNTGQIKDLSKYQCDECKHKYDHSCPVCGLRVFGVRGLATHFRHQREKNNKEHVAHESALEEKQWEGKTKGKDYVACKISGCSYKALTLARHLKAVHGITANHYRQEFGQDVLIRCVELTQRRSKILSHREGGFGLGEKKFVSCPSCEKNHEASKFVSPDVHDLRCLDCKEREEREYEESRWDGLSDPEDYVTCQVENCGQRAISLITHVTDNHPELIGRYKEVYPGAEICALNAGQREESVNKIVLTEESLKPYMDKKGKVMVRHAGFELGISWATVLRNCKALNLPTRNRLAFQKEVLDRIADLLGEEYEWEWKHSDIRNPKTGYYFYYDGFFPKRNLIIEVHGAQHFKFVPNWHKTREVFEANKRRDVLKERLVKAFGYRYFVVQYNELYHSSDYIKGRLYQAGIMSIDEVCVEVDTDLDQSA